MRRRDFISLLGGAAVWPIAAGAQQGERTRRVAGLEGNDESDPTQKELLSAFKGALAEAGWVEGRNLRLDMCWAAGDPERMRVFAKELVDLRPDVIFTASPAATKAMQRETQAIPIVFVGVGDPVAGGLLTNIARPGIRRAPQTTCRRSVGNGWSCLRRRCHAFPGSH
jgi:putative ABC transport system substrate-binding protein